ncbi:MAG: hypothetical protein ACR2OR_06770 [Hyphomicrobiales bacterium]
MKSKSTKLMIAAACGALYFSAAVPAMSMAACAPHGAVIKSLSGKYNETRKAYGLAGGKQMLEIFVSEKGTWTVVVTNLEGIACVIAVGDSWEDAPKVKTGSPT